MNKKLYSLCLLALLCTQPTFGFFGIDKLFSALAPYYINFLKTSDSEKDKDVLSSEQMLWKLKYGNLTDTEFETFAMSRIQKRIDYYCARHAEAIKINDEQKREAIIAELPLFTQYYYKRLKAKDVVEHCYLHTNPKSKAYNFNQKEMAGLTTFENKHNLNQKNLKQKTENNPQIPLSIIILKRPKREKARMRFLLTLEHEITHALEQNFDTCILLKFINLTQKNLVQEAIKKLKKALRRPTTKTIKDIAAYIHHRKSLNDIQITTQKDREYEADFIGSKHVDHKYSLALLFKENLSRTKHQNYPSFCTMYEKILEDNKYFKELSKEQKKKELEIHKHYNIKNCSRKKKKMIFGIKINAALTFALFCAGKTMIKKTASCWGL